MFRLPNSNGARAPARSSPPGTTFSVADIDGVTIVGDTGEIAVEPVAGQATGELLIPVTVTYPDESVDEINRYGPR
ncbi:Rib/alpha-like domain-containing protein [Corynebacterium meridianum]|uniref:YPDG domain-containing protein n=1 Tax=Corynebacterium meridianum TaxID=2765363 RepID=A0A934I5G7_9CORY|nr:YPDG domain-containing protein [Corynebacterium meridianum]